VRDKNVLYSYAHERQINIIDPNQTPRVMRGVWPGPSIFVLLYDTFSQITSHMMFHTLLVFT